MWPILLSFSQALARASLPPGTCQVEGQACDIGQDNLLSAQAGVESLQECEAICIDNFDCEFITFFGSESFPLRNYCMLFQDCSELAECQDCTTAVELCFEQCGQSVEGPLEENVLEVIPGVEDELDCKAICRNQTACQSYTYHNSTDPVLRKICFLLTEIQEPLQSCEHCSTGFPDCRNIPADCSFTVDDNKLSSYMFSEPGTTTVTISPFPALLGECELTALAVGGGGQGGNYGGGGSGYVSSSSGPVPASQLVVRVGGPGEESSLQTGAGETVITAIAGQSNSGGDGGAGYSGGGGCCRSDLYGDGGEDGSDGCGSYGGAGSGLNLASISLQRFSLAPGAAGKKHISGGGYHCGGGGGGVMVDGAGPRDSNHDGEGYGGGMGGYYSETPGSPGPGVVLIEINKK